MFLYRNIIFSVLVSTLLIMSTFVGCSKTGKSYGEKIPESISITKLAQIINTPEQYNDKQVLLEGIVSGQCASLCEFFYKEGAHTVTIFPHKFNLPRLEKGSKVKVYALVTAGEERVVLSAHGLMVE
ncbi:MAG TPA: hypothetical protein VKY57_05875 [Chitinispirillaceae bacterium]|jgi:hypothetical protein|nr:hypothetical protein [Chitinispirillaceae bacterium]